MGQHEGPVSPSQPTIASDLASIGSGLDCLSGLITNLENKVDVLAGQRPPEPTSASTAGLSSPSTGLKGQTQELDERIHRYCSRLEVELDRMQRVLA